jgi:iron complex transport system substrate-binding protein
MMADTRLIRSILRLAFLTLAVLITAACSPPNERDIESSDTGIIIDDYGDTLYLSSSPPTRIVSLNPTTTEIMFAIGASGKLVGRSSWDEWPDSAKFIPALGNAIKPNIEAILAAQPDLVLLYASEDNRSVAQRLRAVGIKTLSFKLDRIAQFDHVTRVIGRVIGDSARAEFVADTVMQTLNRVREATKSLEHPTVVWPYSYRPAMVVGKGSFLNELLEIAGAINLYGDLESPSPIVTIEDVVQKNPKYVLKSADAAQLGPVDPAWYAIPAIREGRLLATPTDVIARPSVQLGQAAVVLARILHPTINLP